MLAYTHAKNTDFHICVASINLLLSLFGPCLESQCTLCGEPEGEWASPFPNSPCHQHLPPCCFAVREGGGDGGGWKHSGGDTMPQTHCSSVFIAAKQTVWAGLKAPWRKKRNNTHKDSVLLTRVVKRSTRYKLHHRANRCSSRRQPSLCT